MAANLEAPRAIVEGVRANLWGKSPGQGSFGVRSWMRPARFTPMKTGIVKTTGRTGQGKAIAAFLPPFILRKLVAFHLGLEIYRAEGCDGEIVKKK